MLFFPVPKSWNTYAFSHPKRGLKKDTSIAEKSAINCKNMFLLKLDLQDEG